MLGVWSIGLASSYILRQTRSERLFGNTLRLSSLRANSYRSLLDVDVPIGSLNLFIGANASGKSTILDALRFLSEAVLERDFRGPMLSRGGMVQLAWKGTVASKMELAVRVANGDNTFDWTIGLFRKGYEFEVEERAYQTRKGALRTQLLEAAGGKGWWWSGERGGKIPLSQSRTSCALAAAAADASFPAHDIAQFIARWGFFDPNPFLLRRDWSSVESPRLDHYGRNLAETLYRLDADTRQRILQATRAIIGLPEDIEPRLAEEEGRFYFVQQEAGLRYRVHQMGVSSGTLRMLALMTALHTSPEPKLIGIEEPENYLHPTALSSFAGYLGDVSENIQLVITTHSPSMLDVLGDPEVVRVVRRDEERGTVLEAGDVEGVRRALKASGFGLGEYYQTRGFGN